MLEIIPHESAHADNRPLPLIVAEKWNFTLAHIQEDVFSGTQFVIGWLECLLQQPEAQPNCGQLHKIAGEKNCPSQVDSSRTLLQMAELT